MSQICGIMREDARLFPGDFARDVENPGGVRPARMCLVFVDTFQDCHLHAVFTIEDVRKDSIQDFTVLSLIKEKAREEQGIFIWDEVEGAVQAIHFLIGREARKSDAEVFCILEGDALGIGFLPRIDEGIEGVDRLLSGLFVLFGHGGDLFLLVGRGSLDLFVRRGSFFYLPRGSCCLTLRTSLFLLRGRFCLRRGGGRYGWLPRECEIERDCEENKRGRSNQNEEFRLHQRGTLLEEPREWRLEVEVGKDEIHPVITYSSQSVFTFKSMGTERVTRTPFTVSVK